MTRAALVGATALAAVGCAESVAPRATVLDAAPLELRADRDDADDVTIRVRYQDADGDLGGGVAEVHDCRAPGLVSRLELPPIAPPDAVARGLDIEGELDLLVADVGVVAPAAAAPAACAALGVPPPSLGALVLCVVLVDAAGHAGPGDCTVPLALAAP